MISLNTICKQLRYRPCTSILIFHIRLNFTFTTLFTFPSSSGLIGMGGMFKINQGKAYQHVMRDFSKTPLVDEQELNRWLKFYEMPATLTAVGTLITHENVSRWMTD